MEISVLPTLSTFCLDSIITTVGGEIQAIILEKDNCTKESSNDVIAHSRRVLEKYLAIGKANQPSADLIGSFCKRVATLGAHFEFLILSLLSEYASEIRIFRYVPLSRCLIDTCASSLGFGLQSLVVKDVYVGLSFISALASSGAAQSLQKLSLKQNGLSPHGDEPDPITRDASSLLWSQFPILRYLKLLNVRFVSNTMVESIITSIPTLSSFFIVSICLDLEPVLRAVTTRPCFERFGAHFSDLDLDEETFSQRLDLLRSWEARDRLVCLDLGYERGLEAESTHICGLLEVFPNLVRMKGAYDEDQPSLSRSMGLATVQSFDDDSILAMERETIKAIIVSNMVEPISLSRIPSFSRYLKKFTLLANEVEGSVDPLMEALLRCKRLIDLSLRLPCGLTLAHARAALTELPDLQILVIENQEQVGDGVLYVSHASLTRRPQVRVQDCNQVVAVWLPRAELAPAPSADAQRFPNLRSLSLQANKFDMASITPYAPKLVSATLQHLDPSIFAQGFWSLQQLHIMQSVWSGNHLETALAQCPLLTLLEIDNAGAEVLELHSSALSHKRLKNINLSHVKFQDEASFDILPDALPSLETVALGYINNLVQLKVSNIPHLRFVEVTFLKSSKELGVDVSDCPELRVLSIQHLDKPVRTLHVVGVPKLHEVRLCAASVEKALVGGHIKLQLPRAARFECDRFDPYSSEIQSVISTLEDNTVFIPNTKNCDPCRPSTVDE